MFILYIPTIGLTSFARISKRNNILRNIFWLPNLSSAWLKFGQKYCLEWRISIGLLINQDLCKYILTSRMKWIFFSWVSISYMKQWFEWEFGTEPGPLPTSQLYVALTTLDIWHFYRYESLSHLKLYNKVRWRLKYPHQIIFFISKWFMVLVWNYTKFFFHLFYVEL